MRQGKILSPVESTFFTFLQVRRIFACMLLVVSLSGNARSQASGLGISQPYQASGTNQPYNLRLGPVSIRANASMLASYNDNINGSQAVRLADFIINPSVGIHALWQATELNALTFDIGLGYDLYTVHSQNSYYSISPGSQISFNILIGDVKVNLHDNFSYQQDPLLVPQLSNASRFPILTNDAGIEASWELSDFIFSTGYDHINYLVFADGYQNLTREEDALTPQFTYKINPVINAGISSSFSETKYDKNPENSNTSISGGPFVKGQLTSSLSVAAQLGYISTIYPDAGSIQGGGNNGSGNINSYYGSVGVTHKINEVFAQTLTGGRDFLPGLTSNYTQRTYANYRILWQAATSINLTANVSVQNLVDSVATISENSNCFQGGLNLDYALTPHATIRLGYQYTLKDANINDDSYSQNLITTGCLYQF